MIIQQQRVPTIGLQPKQVQIAPGTAGTLISVTMLCDCGSDVPVLIPNVDRAGLCTRCKTKYVISKVQFQNDSGLISMNTEVAKWRGPMSASKEMDVELEKVV